MHACDRIDACSNSSIHSIHFMQNKMSCTITMASRNQSSQLKKILIFVLVSALISLQPLVANGNHAARYLRDGEYERLVKSDDRFLVNFITPGCVKCGEFAPEYLEVAKYFATEKKDMNIQVYIEGELSVIRKEGLRRLPSLYYVREKTPILYTGDMNADKVIQWVELTGRKIHLTLTDNDFEHLTQAATGATTGDWLVLFCDTRLSDCTILLPMWESVAFKLHSVINVAVVDTETNPRLAKRFKLSGAPSVHLFRRGKRYFYNLQLRDDNTIVGFATNGYKQMSGVDVELEPSPFDTLTENIADQIKEVVPPEHASKALYGVIFVIVIIIVLLYFCTRGRSKGGLPVRSKKGV